MHDLVSSSASSSSSSSALSPTLLDDPLLLPLLASTLVLEDAASSPSIGGALAATASERERVCVFVCVCLCVSVSVCLCLCAMGDRGEKDCLWSQHTKQHAANKHMNTCRPNKSTTSPDLGFGGSLQECGLPLLCLCVAGTIENLAAVHVHLVANDEHRRRVLLFCFFCFFCF